MSTREKRKDLAPAGAANTRSTVAMVAASSGGRAARSITVGYFGGRDGLPCTAAGPGCRESAIARGGARGVRRRRGWCDRRRPAPPNLPSPSPPPPPHTPPPHPPPPFPPQPPPCPTFGGSTSMGWGGVRTTLP